MSVGSASILTAKAIALRSITCTGGNLFEIAATQLGSALQWISIAKVNNITDPVLIGQNVVVIPAISPAFADGIGPQ